MAEASRWVESGQASLRMCGRASAILFQSECFPLTFARRLTGYAARATIGITRAEVTVRRAA